MDMPDVGLAASGTAVGIIGTVLTAWLKSRRAGRKAPEAVAITPDPLRVDLQKTYATKAELRELEERIREDIRELRDDIKKNDEKAEARTTATHRRIDAVLASVQGTHR